MSVRKSFWLAPASWFLERIPGGRRSRIAAALTAPSLWRPDAQAATVSCRDSLGGRRPHVARSGRIEGNLRSPRSLAAKRRTGPGCGTSRPPSSNRPVRRVIVVSWNVAVGSADVVAFPAGSSRTQRGRTCRSCSSSRRPTGKAATVPVALDGDARFASRLGFSDSPEPHRQDIATIAETTGLNVYYAPSMRNGSPLSSAEDRGNAILSSSPLTDLAAIELPLERQRRVAIAATVAGVSASGEAWKLRVVSAHLDNVAGPRRLWVFGSEARPNAAGPGARRHTLADPGPTVLAGRLQHVVRVFRSRVCPRPRAPSSRTVTSDRRATFRGLLRLDHVFFRLPTGWRATRNAGSSRFGSDHFPLIGTIDADCRLGAVVGVRSWELAELGDRAVVKAGCRC